MLTGTCCLADHHLTRILVLVDAHLLRAVHDGPHVRASAPCCIIRLVSVWRHDALRCMDVTLSDCRARIPRLSAGCGL